LITNANQDGPSLVFPRTSHNAAGTNSQKGVAWNLVGVASPTKPNPL